MSSGILISYRRPSAFNTSDKKQVQKIRRNYSQYINKSGQKSPSGVPDHGKNYNNFIYKWKNDKSLRKKYDAPYGHKDSHDYSSTNAVTSKTRKPRVGSSINRSHPKVSSEYSISIKQPVESDSEEAEIPDELDDYLENGNNEGSDHYYKGVAKNRYSNYSASSKKLLKQDDDYSHKGKGGFRNSENFSKKGLGHNLSYNNLLNVIDQSTSVMSSFKDKKSSVAHTRSSVFQKDLKPTDKSPSKLVKKSKVRN